MSRFSYGSWPSKRRDWTKPMKSTRQNARMAQKPFSQKTSQTEQSSKSVGASIANSCFALEAEDLSFSYHEEEPVFTNVNFSLSRGEVLTILGPNGAGKSTLLNCLGGILKPTRGQVRLLGDPIDKLDQQCIATRLGYVPQIQNTAVDFSVRDYLVLGRAPYIGRFRSPSKAD